MKPHSLMAEVRKTQEHFSAAHAAYIRRLFPTPFYLLHPWK